MNTFFLFIGGPEVFIIVLIVVLFFGADKIPEIARGLGKGMRQVKDATNEIKNEINESAKAENVDINKNIKEQVEEVKENIDDLTGSIKRNL